MHEDKGGEQSGKMVNLYACIPVTVADISGKLIGAGISFDGSPVNKEGYRKSGMMLSGDNMECAIL